MELEGAGEKLESWSWSLAFPRESSYERRLGTGGTGEETRGGWDLGMNDISGRCSAVGSVLDTSEVQERRVVTHLKPPGWLVELAGSYAWA